ncbi:MAG: tyrosine-type recombinase/integrase [Planctomycetota bacterium]|nr:tyrosine-type recombinase/integrase [Planctomycetota bacterium]
MTDLPPPPATSLRERFRAIPRDVRQANQPFSIRVWRGLSWLERSEKADDPEGRLISLWIAFNSIYGYLEDDDRDTRDHTSWQRFLARLVRQDAGDTVGRIIREHQRDILKLVDNKFLFRPFWLGQQEADFHALRHTYVSRLVRSGANIKVAQELARHSTPMLTLGRYAHVQLVDQTRALDALPSIDATRANVEALAATGT